MSTLLSCIMAKQNNLLKEFKGGVKQKAKQNKMPAKKRKPSQAQTTEW